MLEDFPKDPGGQDFSKMKSQYSLFVDALGSKQVSGCVSHEIMDYCINRNLQHCVCRNIS